MYKRQDSEGNEYAEFTKEFADSMGIIVRGEFTDHDNFRIEYYIPYFYGHGITCLLYTSRCV